MKKICMTAVLTAALAGCGDAGREKALQDQVTMLQAEVAALKGELDEERNGAPRLLAKAEGEIKSGNPAAAGTTLSTLIAKHPGTDQATKAEMLLVDIQLKAEAEAEKARKEAERKAKEEQELLARAERNLSRSTDEIRGITWLKHKDEPVLQKKMALYFGTKDNSAEGYPLRLRLQYFDDDWLFVNAVTIKAGEQMFELRTGSFERDNGSGSIWEWSDEPVPDFKMLDAVLAAEKVIIRFHGQQYYDDFVLPEKQKAAMREVLSAWLRYGGKRT